MLSNQLLLRPLPQADCELPTNTHYIGHYRWRPHQKGRVDQQFFDSAHHNLSHHWNRFYFCETPLPRKPKGSLDLFLSVLKNVGLAHIQGEFFQIHILPTNPDQLYSWMWLPSIPGETCFPGEQEMLSLYRERTGSNAYPDDRSNHVKSLYSQWEVNLSNSGQLAESVVPRNWQELQNWRKPDQMEPIFSIFTNNVECPRQINCRESVDFAKAWRSGRLTSGSSLSGVLR